MTVQKCCLTLDQYHHSLRQHYTSDVGFVGTADHPQMGDNIDLCQIRGNRFY